MTEQSNNKSGFSEIPVWKKVVPIGGFVAGLALVYAWKKCWGCAIAGGAGLGLVFAIPLGMDVVKIGKVEIKPKAGGQSLPSPSASSGMSATSPDVKSTAIVADLKALLGGDAQKSADFDKQMPQIQAAIGKLTDTEKSAMIETLTATKNATASPDADAGVSGLMAQMQSITSKYGQPTMDSLNEKMGAIEKEFGISSGS